MDGSQFDNLVRTLARGTSRRGLFRGLTGALGAALVGERVADAAQRPARQANGAACTRATDCASFQCVDGVCCDTACPGQCESCATGTCQPVSGAPAPGKAACPGSGPCAATCDGVTTSHCAAYPGPETSCGAATCADGRQTTHTCGGNGACVPTTTNCVPTSCNAAGTGCAAGCMTDGDCAAGFHCDAGQCLPAAGLGAPCGEDADCQTGVCFRGVCCSQECGPCQVCNDQGICTNSTVCAGEGEGQAPTCGESGQPCCPEGDPCIGNRICLSASWFHQATCQPCGESGQPCCPGSDPCIGDLTCRSTLEDGTWVENWAWWEDERNWEDDWTWESGLPPDTCQPPPPCGEFGQPCCTEGDACRVESRYCDPATDTCQPCGIAGKPCCPPDNTCTSGFSCDANNICRR